MKVRIVVIRYVVLVVLLPLLGSACGSIGPKKITTDRLDYSTVLAESWKKQMLLNIIKVRYLDLPIFLDVGQLVTGYSMETSVNAGGSVASGSGVGSIGASGKYTDRPTITYMPMTGDKFLESFLTPIQPHHVHSSSEKPKHSYVTVSYEGEWFWIAEDEWDSKNTFSSILFLFTLAGNYGSEGLPTITIPTY